MVAVVYLFPGHTTAHTYYAECGISFRIHATSEMTAVGGDGGARCFGGASSVRQNRSLSGVVGR